MFKKEGEFMKNSGSAAVSRNESVKTGKMLKRIVVLGATGSVGTSALRVIDGHRDRLELIGIAGGIREIQLQEAARMYGVAETSLYDREGEAGLERLATMPEADMVLVASTGTAALKPALAALSSGKDLAIANKEILVVGGELLMEAAGRSKGRIIPVDSEHSAIFQCLEGNRRQEDIRRILLTASGGAFRDTPAGELDNVTVEDALRHPTWSMGPKITIDCATMANKGLEMIEACRLFNVKPEQVEVVIHPQSIVHSMVEFCDYSTLAQMSLPSMLIAIQYAFFYPDRAAGIHKPLDFTSRMSLDFRPPDEIKFPCLRLAREALDAGGFYPAVFSIANEAAVDAFLNYGIRFSSIPAVISEVLEKVDIRQPSDIDALLNAETEVNAAAEAVVDRYSELSGYRMIV